MVEVRSGLWGTEGGSTESMGYMVYRMLNSLRAIESIGYRGVDCGV